MVRRYQRLFNSILFKEICEFLRNELGPLAETTSSGNPYAANHSLI